jgi:hypothetical protein
MSMKIADTPQTLVPKDATSTDEPITIELEDDSDATPVVDGGASEPQAEPSPRRAEGTLSAQLADLNAAEQHRQQLAAQQYYQQQQLHQERQQRQQAEYDSVMHLMETEHAHHEQAQNDLAAGWRSGDYHAAAEAQGRMIRAQTTLSQLEQKAEYFNQQMPSQAAQPQAPPPPPTPEQIINNMPALIPEERAWLMKHQDLVSNPAMVDELKGTYNAAQRMGLKRGTPEYFQFFEDRLGLADDSDAGEQPVQQPSPPLKKAVRAQAPVSRGGHSLTNGRHVDTGNRITLTSQERDAARWSGISEHDYAVQKKKLMEYKRKGYYTEQN